MFLVCILRSSALHGVYERCKTVSVSIEEYESGCFRYALFVNTSDSNAISIAITFSVLALYKRSCSESDERDKAGPLAPTWRRQSTITGERDVVVLQISLFDNMNWVLSCIESSFH